MSGLSAISKIRWAWETKNAHLLTYIYYEDLLPVLIIIIIIITRANLENYNYNIVYVLMIQKC